MAESFDTDYGMAVNDVNEELISDAVIIDSEQDLFIDENSDVNLSVKFCTHCGKEISQLGNFCKNCGNKITQ